MRIREFGVETWMNRWETGCRFNLAETCVDSLTVGQLLEIAGARDALLGELLPMRLLYGAIQGSERLRAAISALYSTVGADRVLVAHGAIGANALVHQALVEPGDRVISVLPTYQQHQAIPAALGADVRPLWLRESNAWQLDLDELRRLADGPTRLIALTNPNNPTGALLDRAALEQVAAIADAVDAFVLVDEVYRGLEQPGVPAAPSIADLTPRGISTGSMSKAFSLAGLRLGWVAGPDHVLAAVMRHRDYTTISVSMVDDLLATLALEHADAILARSRAIVHANLATLDAWVAGEPALSYVKPRAGTTALLAVDARAGGGNSTAFCERLLGEAGVLLVPGSVMDVEGHVRIGYANGAGVLAAGLDAIAELLARA